MNIMTEDAKAILLLCGHLGGPSEFEPLDQRDYNQVVRWLLGNKMRPENLLSPEHIPALAAESGIPEKRLTGLLKRGVKLGFAVEQWNQSGIWVICRSDPDYPARLREHLKDKAPPILYGAGERSLLQGGGLAIVGSRNVDSEGEAFARDVAAWCAKSGFPVVSGGARGVDQIAMLGAIEAGGVVVGVLADSLLRKSVSREARYALSDSRLVLISPYHPEAGFNVGTAMGRNKLIYALADYGLVVSAEHKKGGTWEGAQEELRRKPGRPVFVRLTDSVPLGNKKLVGLGAVGFPSITGSQNPATLLQQASIAQVKQAQEYELPLFEQPIGNSMTLAAVRETPPIREEKAKTPLSPSPQNTPTIYDAILPVILTALEKPASTSELAERLEVSKTQLEAWLKRALSDQKVRKTGRPMRYVSSGSCIPS